MEEKKEMVVTNPPAQAAPPRATAGGPSFAPIGPVHPPSEQLHHLHFCIDSRPSWPETVMLAFEHYIVMLGSTVKLSTLLVPQMGGDNIFVRTMRAIQGALIVSSFFNIIIGYSKAWGNYTRLCSPVVIVPVVCVVGVGLFERGFPKVGKCFEIGLPMLILLVICQQYLKNIHESAHSLLERFGMLSAL